MRIGHTLIAATVLLAGCGGRGEEGGNNSTEAATTSSAPVDENLYEDAQNRAVPIAAPSSRPVAGVVPAAFQGRWALTENDCDPALADAKGLMVVEAGALRFYESRASVAQVTATGTDRLDLRVAFSGEGQQWTADQTLTLVDGGRTLVRDEPSPPTSLRYARCPA